MAVSKHEATVRGFSKTEGYRQFSTDTIKPTFDVGMNEGCVNSVLSGEIWGCHSSADGLCQCVDWPIATDVSEGILLPSSG